MSFTRYLEIFGSFDYQVPEDKEQQLYDFYMLSLLHGQSSFQRNIVDRPNTDIPKPTKVGTFNNEDKIDYMLDEVAKRLLPQLKKNLLDAVFFAICAELRHVYDYLTSETLYKLLGLLNSRQKDAFTKYNKNYLLWYSVKYLKIYIINLTVKVLFGDIVQKILAIADIIKDIIIYQQHLLI